VHILSFANQSLIKLGRGQETDARIPDISVSRIHAQFEFYRDNFYIEDLHSKFGTIILLKESLTISHSSKSAQLQVGRHLFVFSLKDSLKPNR